MSLDIFDILFLITLDVCMCTDFMTSALIDCWSSVIIMRIIYKLLNMCPFDCTAFVVNGKVWIPKTGLTNQFDVSGYSNCRSWTAIVV